MDVAYSYGNYDVLRAKDLNDLDKNIQYSKNEGSDCFALGIYSTELCKELGISEPLKSQEDRMKIMEQIRGVDFTFPVNKLDENELLKTLKMAYSQYIKRMKEAKDNVEKKYEIGYAPGTYDLFHAGHLENLMIAAEQSKKVIVGVKANELVFEHKHKKPVIDAEERMDILRHFKFVYDVYKYYTRDLLVANNWIKSKYGKGIDAVFLGSDLEKDFADVEGINIVFTPRDPEKMKVVSTTAYRTLHLGRTNENYTGKKPEEQLNKKKKGKIEIKERE